MLCLTFLPNHYLILFYLVILNIEEFQKKLFYWEIYKSFFAFQIIFNPDLINYYTFPFIFSHNHFLLIYFQLIQFFLNYFKINLFASLLPFILKFQFHHLFLHFPHNIRFLNLLIYFKIIVKFIRIYFQNRYLINFQVYYFELSPNIEYHLNFQKPLQVLYYIWAYFLQYLIIHLLIHLTIIFLIRIVTKE